MLLILQSLTVAILDYMELPQEDKRNDQGAQICIPKLENNFPGQKIGQKKVSCLETSLEQS